MAAAGGHSCSSGCTAAQMEQQSQRYRHLSYRDSAKLPDTEAVMLLAAHKS
jgi:hypothetical protein